MAASWRLADILGSMMVLTLVLWGLYQRYSRPITCEMTYMYPGYHQIIDPELQKAPRYSLQLYREQGDVIQGHPPSGWPMLFIPGSGGTYEQVRSLASETARQVLKERKKLEGSWGALSADLVDLDWYAIDVKEELAALDGQILEQQLQYAQVCLSYLSRVYNISVEPQGNRSPAPPGVILVGHSMGGIVAQGVIRRMREAGQDPPVLLLLLLASPSRHHPLLLQPSFARLYASLTSCSESAVAGDDCNGAPAAYWGAQVKCPGSLPVISIHAGHSDMQISHQYTGMSRAVDHSWGCGLGRPLHFSSSDMAGVWASGGHSKILSCNQLVQRVAAMLLDTVWELERSRKKLELGELSQPLEPERGQQSEDTGGASEVRNGKTCTSGKSCIPWDKVKQRVVDTHSRRHFETPLSVGLGLEVQGDAGPTYRGAIPWYMPEIVGPGSLPPGTTLSHKGPRVCQGPNLAWHLQYSQEETLKGPGAHFLNKKKLKGQRGHLYQWQSNQGLESGSPSTPTAAIVLVLGLAPCSDFRLWSTRQAHESGEQKQGDQEGSERVAEGADPGHGGRTSSWSTSELTSFFIPLPPLTSDMRTTVLKEEMWLEVMKGRNYLEGAAWLLVLPRATSVAQGASNDSNASTVESKVENDEDTGRQEEQHGGTGAAFRVGDGLYLWTKLPSSKSATPFVVLQEVEWFTGLGLVPALPSSWLSNLWSRASKDPVTSVSPAPAKQTNQERRVGSTTSKTKTRSRLSPVVQYYSWGNKGIGTPQTALAGPWWLQLVGQVLAVTVSQAETTDHSQCFDPVMILVGPGEDTTHPQVVQPPERGNLGAWQSQLGNRRTTRGCRAGTKSAGSNAESREAHVMVVSDPRCHFLISIDLDLVGYLGSILLIHGGVVLGVCLSLSLLQLGSLYQSAASPRHPGSSLHDTHMLKTMFGPLIRGARLFSNRDPLSYWTLLLLMLTAKFISTTLSSILAAVSLHVGSQLSRVFDLVAGQVVGPLVPRAISASLALVVTQTKTQQWLSNQRRYLSWWLCEGVDVSYLDVVVLSCISWAVWHLVLGMAWAMNVVVGAALTWVTHKKGGTIGEVTPDPSTSTHIESLGTPVSMDAVNGNQSEIGTRGSLTYGAPQEQPPVLRKPWTGAASALLLVVCSMCAWVHPSIGVLLAWLALSIRTAHLWTARDAHRAGLGAHRQAQGPPSTTGQCIVPSGTEKLQGGRKDHAGAISVGTGSTPAGGSHGGDSAAVPAGLWVWQLHYLVVVLVMAPALVAWAQSQHQGFWAAGLGADLLPAVVMICHMILLTRLDRAHPPTMQQGAHLSHQGSRSLTACNTLAHLWEVLAFLLLLFTLRGRVVLWWFIYGVTAACAITWPDTHT